MYVGLLRPWISSLCLGLFGGENNYHSLKDKPIKSVYAWISFKPVLPSHFLPGGDCHSVKVAANAHLIGFEASVAYADLSRES